MSDRVVTAGVLIIGNEILSGRTQDVNLTHIARELNDWGIRVREARVIPDVDEIVIEAVRDSSHRFDYVFTTGGIGPTHDDITAECVARAFEVDLVEHPDIAAVIRAREAPPDVLEARLRMARVPAGARLIDNPTGGPQGFAIGNVHVMAGIPRVMQAMLSTLRDQLQGGAPVRSCSVTAYLGESQIAAPLADLQQRYPEVDLGSYPFSRDGRYGTSLVMRGTDPARLAAMLKEAQAIIVAAGETPEDIRAP